MPQNLSAEQTPGLTVAGDADGQASRARAVGSVIPSLALDSDRIKSGGRGLMVKKTGSGRDKVKDLN
jgi:hypothetical protein